jgi:Divergent InlB B-repeat domain
VAALVLALGLIGVQAPLHPVAAWPSYCNPNEYACATVSVVLFGNGSAHAYDDQGELDCYWNGGSGNTTCTGNYYWIRQMYPNGQLPVTVTIAPTPNSWACIGSDPNGPSCKPIGVPLQRAYLLSDLATISDGYSANLGKTLSITISGSGDGAGEVTSSPSGMNCTVNGGVTSGTCHANWYFKDSVTVTFTSTPAEGNGACNSFDSACNSSGPVGQAAQEPITISGSDDRTLYVRFDKGHPILTVGVTGQGSVVSSPAGISCPGTCTKYFAPNSNVTLSAAAKSGYVFQRWTGACSGYGSTCNLSLGSSDVSTTATFVQPAAPTPTPRSTAHVLPSATPRATSSPIATPRATSGPGGTSLPGPSIQPSAPGASAAAAPSAAAPDPGASNAVAVAGSSAPTIPPALGASPASSQTPVSGDAPTQSAGIDPLVLLLLVVIVLLVLALGFALGLRQRRPAA